MRVASIGLGKLGVCAAVVFSDAGHQVTGIDIAQDVVMKLRKGQSHIVEPNLQNYLINQDGRLRFDTGFSAVNDADIINIIVPTPSNQDGKFSNEYILTAIRSMGEYLRNRQSYFVVVVTSTIMPGTMRAIICPEIEKIIGRRVGNTWGLVYSPEFIALGSVIHNMHYPDAVLIGQSDNEAGKMVAKFQSSIIKHECPIVRTSWENAEISKIALNSYVTTKIAFANLLSQICDTYQSANVDEVTRFLGLDSRIGPKYIKAGLPVGGCCFPRDAKAFSTVLPYDNSIPLAVGRFNDRHVEYIAEKINEELCDKSVVSILGTSFKPNTPVTECSASFAIGRRLESKGHRVKYYDPQAQCDCTLTQCLKGADIAVLATPWDEFEDIDLQMMADYMRTLKVYDCWRLWDRERFTRAGFSYVALGVNG